MTGRPPKYSSQEELAPVIEEYFKLCDKNKQIPNKAGLRYALDISRDTYGEYKKQFPDTIKRAEDYMEQAWVNRLNSQSPTGAIFYLKNAFKEDYRDRQETDITSGGKEIKAITGMIIKEDGDSVQNKES